MTSRGRITIAGAGLVGSLLSIILARRGYTVDLYEYRADSRKANIYQGKSINLALSERGWRALKLAGVEDAIRREAIPMHRRVIHGIEGNLGFQPYGKEGQAIYSVSRGGLNQTLLTLAEAEENVQLHFEHRLTDVDFKTAKTFFVNQQNKTLSKEADYLFAADGGFSQTRRMMELTPRFSYSLDYIDHGYIELTIPPNTDGKHQLEKEALHIWPRGDFMLIALPNQDGSFTCTLFLPYEGKDSFAVLKTRESIEAFFDNYFRDALTVLKEPIKEFMQKEPAPLTICRAWPWSRNNKVCLIGDAAHGIVPFYGQGMNAGFEDCRILDEMIEQYNHDWNRIFPAFEKDRKRNTDAIAELAMRNFVEMRADTANPQFLLRKKIEAHFHKLHPDLWLPLYSMVTFTHIPYAKALAIGEQQKKLMDQLMQKPNIEKEWQQDWVYQALYELAIKEFGEPKHDK